MINWFKKHFVPHVHNEHRPHFLRSKSVTMFLATVLFIEAAFLFSAFALGPTLNWLSAIAPSILVDYANASRTEQNLNVLQTNSLLQQAAQLKADHMAANEYFAHTSPDGTEPWDWLDQVGYNYQTAGENLAVNFIDSSDVHEAWMDSPSHRDNILKHDYTEIGIATARGVYKGYESIYVAQFFGKPKQVTSFVVLTTPSPEPTVFATVAPEQTAEPTPTPVQPIVKTDSFISFNSVAAAEEVPPANEAIITTASEPSVIAKIFASPRNLANYLLYALATIASVALGLAVIAKLEHQDSHVVLNGVLATSVVFAMILVNHYLGFIQTTII